MKKVTLLFAALALMGSVLRAQTPIAVPNGSFEQWTTHPGYSVTALFFPISVYGSYSTPTLWGYPTYPVNQTVTFMSVNVNINTSIPLILSTQETGSVPDSNTAVRLQTFMLSDIISSTVLTLASGSLDSNITNQVIPSVLLTGEVDIEALLPIVSSMQSDSNTLQSMVPTLLAMDVNDYLMGGISLGGLEPDRLTGSYKYHSAVSGDNGAVVLLGTRYNADSNRRDLVGLGINLDLTDTSAYTPFEVGYQPLSQWVSGGTDLAPDTIAVLLLSSAGSNMQQGSYLCLDNLRLWTAPSSCSAVMDLAAAPRLHEASLTWAVSDSVVGFEVEYGSAGFTLGDGAALTTADTALTLTGLAANTAYDVYVRSQCADSVYGAWSSVHFTTLADTCAAVVNLTLASVTYDAFPQYVLEWTGSFQPTSWQVVYVPHGFPMDGGTIVETSETRLDIYALEQNHLLAPNTLYDFYVYSVCGEDVFGAWDSVQYLTACAMVGDLAVQDDEEHLRITPDNTIDGYSVSWTDTTDTPSWVVVYGIYDPEYPDLWGTTVWVDTPYFAFPPLAAGRTYSVMVAALCGDDNTSDVQWLNFTTLTLDGIDNPCASAPSLLTVTPNPAEGHCVVTPAGALSAELQLFTVEGRMVQRAVTEGAPVALRLPEAGVYILRATTPAGVATYRIVNR